VILQVLLSLPIKAQNQLETNNLLYRLVKFEMKSLIFNGKMIIESPQKQTEK
jgi:hypothetical protein